MGEVLFGQQRQLLVIGGIVCRQGVLAAMVDDPLTLDVLDDCGITRRVLHREMEIRVVAVRADFQDVDVLQQRQRFGYRRRLVQQVLQPHSRRDSRFGRIAWTKIGNLQIQPVHRESGFVQSVHRANPVEGGDQTGITTGPPQRVGIGDESRRIDPVTVPAARERGDEGLGGFRPVHAASGQDGKVVRIPQHAGAHDAHAT